MGVAAAVTVLTRWWRTRWTSLLTLALLVGLSGGLGLAAVAGARRSASSVRRFDDAARTLDVFVADDVITPEPPGLRALLDGPLVERANDMVFLFTDVDAVGYFFARTSHRGLDVERGVLLRGRHADPDAPDEVELSEVAARHLHASVGDTLRLGTLSPAQAEALFTSGEEPTDLRGPRVPLRVVGIIRNGFDLADHPGDPSFTMTTPAFLEKYGAQVGVGSRSHLVRLADVPHAVDRFTDALTDVYKGRHLPSVTVGQGEDTVRASISVITVGLLALAAVILISGAAWMVSSTTRHQRLATGGTDVLRALGASPRARRALLVGAVLPALLVGVALVPVVAVALSPLLPVGVARHVDPDTGLHADLAVLVIGTAALAVVLAVAAVISASRSDRTSRRERPIRAGSPGVANRMARALRPVPGTGVRFALQASGESSAPMPPALLGALIVVVGLVAVVVVGGNLQRLVDTPARWGTTWDATLGVTDTERPTFLSNAERAALLDDADVAAASVLLYDEQVTVNGVEAIAMTLDPVKGDIAPTVVEGREPRAPDEIALARDTLDAIGVPIGASVEVGSRTNFRGRYRVVGVIAFPTIGEPTAIATGAALTRAGGDRLHLGDTEASNNAGTLYLAVRWARSVDHHAAVARLGHRGALEVPPATPPEVKGLIDVRRFPLLGAAALIALGMIATGLGLVTSVRRRRAELGVLSALGFAPQQRRLVIVWQATTMAVVALLVGVPLGAVLGRVVWSAIARSIGVATDATFPLVLLALGAVGIVVVLNAIAALPARAAARLAAADALRAE